MTCNKFLLFLLQMVPPGGNTTFDVVFLARQVGPVENTLYIHTTQGSFKYQVSCFFFLFSLSPDFVFQLSIDRPKLLTQPHYFTVIPHWFSPK